MNKHATQAGVPGGSAAGSVAEWLQELPHVDNGVDTVKGQILAVTPLDVTIGLGNTRLTFAVNDVVRAVPADLPREAVLHLRQGARLLAARVTQDDVAASRRPFGLCTRQEVTRAAPAPRFRRLEQEFVRKYGYDLSE